MEFRDDTGAVMRGFQATFGASSLSSISKQRDEVDVPAFNGSQVGASLHDLNLENKKPCVLPSHPNHPPLSPYSRILAHGITSQPGASSKFSPGPSHSRSLSQPSFFPLDSLPPLSPITYHDPSPNLNPEHMLRDVSMENKIGTSLVLSHPSSVARTTTYRLGVTENFPLHKGHRRSNSDIPLGFSAMVQSSPQLIPIESYGITDGSMLRESYGAKKPIQLIKHEPEYNRNGKNTVEVMGVRQCQGEIVDDLVSAYMDWDHINALNSSSTDDKDLDNRVSGARTGGAESSDNEVESHKNGNPVCGRGLNLLTDKKEGLKRSAAKDISPCSTHRRSISVDSFLENLKFDDELLKQPSGEQKVKQTSSDSMDGNTSKSNKEFLNREFNASELKKVVENEKLSEIASSDPKRAKRILANRQSAARSKERKMMYIAELEHKVQTLQTEIKTLSYQVMTLQNEYAGLRNQNNEFKFRLNAMEQQGQLRDALSETLSAETQRLKVVAAELGGEAHLSNCMAQQLSINRPTLLSQHQQTTQLNKYQLQQKQHQQLQSQQHRTSA